MYKDVEEGIAYQQQYCPSWRVVSEAGQVRLGGGTGVSLGTDANPFSSSFSSSLLLRIYRYSIVFVLIEADKTVNMCTCASADMTLYAAQPVGGLGQSTSDTVEEEC